MKSLRFISIFILSFLFLPAAQTQTIDCFILQAPEIPLYDMKKIGVLKFDCSTNSRKDIVLTNYIVAALLDQHRGIYDKKGSFYGLGKAKQGKTFVKGVTTDFK